MSDQPRPPDIGQRPSDAYMRLAYGWWQPWRLLTSPEFLGFERIPDERPLLFVGNHTLFGMVDAPMFTLEVWRRRRVYLRALGDHFHFRVPVWSEMVRQFGVVDGTPDNADALMEAGEAVLVFPGGAREATKRRRELHQLVWGDRLGFVRLAVRHGCPIVPFAAVGADDAFDILVDGDELGETPVGAMMERMGIRPDMFPPIVRGWGPTVLPRPERLYYMVQPPIPTAPHRGCEDDDALCRQIRDRVAASIEQGIDLLRSRQAVDPRRTLMSRLRGLFGPR